jgi:hypothetical protein
MVTTRHEYMVGSKIPSPKTRQLSSADMADARPVYKTLRQTTSNVKLLKTHEMLMII